MNILYLAWNFPPATGGMEYTSGKLFERLQKLGYSMTAVARHDPHGSGGSSHVFRPSRPGLLFYQFFSLVMGWRLMMQNSYDLIICPGITNGPVAWLLSRCFRKPYLMLAHGSDILHEGRLYRHVMRFLFRHANGIASNTAMTKALLEREGVCPSNIRVIYPSVETDRFPPRREVGDAKEERNLSGRKVLLSVGRLIRRKGVLDFIENVMPALTQRFPELVYVVVGGNATQSLIHHERMFDRISRRIKELHLENHVRLMGEIDGKTLHELYYASDIFVLPVMEIPGDVEGFGLVFIEAGLAGMPVVSTRVGGIPEAVLDGKTGILLNSEDWTGMAKVLGELLEDASQREAMGANGRQRALEAFAWTAIEQQYSNYIDQVAAHHDSGVHHVGS
jgi:phosphatidylinositol alpha-1,6-mannosyltransferase